MYIPRYVYETHDKNFYDGCHVNIFNLKLKYLLKSILIEWTTNMDEDEYKKKKHTHTHTHTNHQKINKYLVTIVGIMGLRVLTINLCVIYSRMFLVIRKII